MKVQPCVGTTITRMVPGFQRHWHDMLMPLRDPQFLIGFTPKTETEFYQFYLTVESVSYRVYMELTKLMGREQEVLLALQL